MNFSEIVQVRQRNRVRDDVNQISDRTRRLSVATILMIVLVGHATQASAAVSRDEAGIVFQTSTTLTVDRPMAIPGAIVKLTSQTSGVSWSDVAVSFYLDGTLIGTAVTDANSQAQLTHKLGNLSAGPHTFTATFPETARTRTQRFTEQIVDRDTGKILASQIVRVTYHDKALVSSGNVSIRILIDSPPLILAQPTNLTVFAGSKVDISADIVGSAPVLVQWRLNGSPVPGATNSILSLTNVQASQAGSYVVAATNTWGSITSSPATLVLVDPPVLTVQPQAKAVLIGSMATFSALGAEPGQFSFQWRFNGNPLPGVTNSTLTLTDLAISQAGSYTAVASNPMGSINSSAATLVVVNPSTLVPFQNQAVPEGTNVTLTVGVAFRDFPFTYQWRRNGRNIAGATTASLTLASFRPSDAGSYTVAISDGTMSVAVPIGTLIIRPEAFFFGAPSILFDERVQLTLTGKGATDYTIEVSTNLMLWTTLTNLSSPNGAMVLVDAELAKHLRRFYRAKITGSRPEIPNMVWINPGTFTMGSPAGEVDRLSDEGPQTKVTLTHGFLMGEYEVTQADYQAVMGYNPSSFKGDLNRPVESVSWHEATNYCAKLTEKERQGGRLPAGYVYRLPTEAEWEHAGRAGTITRFAHGDDPGYTALGNYAWYFANSANTTHPIGQKLANAWGLYDMHGNIWEWCLDWYGSYPGGSTIDPRGPASGSIRVIRGGGWRNNGGNCRSAYRSYSPPNSRNYGGLGFRVVLAPGQ